MCFWFVDWINWDTLNQSFVATNEASRSFLASFILVMDLLIVMQASSHFPLSFCIFESELELEVGFYYSLQLGYSIDFHYNMYVKFVVSLKLLSYILSSTISTKANTLLLSRSYWCVCNWLLQLGKKLDLFWLIILFSVGLGLSTFHKCPGH